MSASLFDGEALTDAASQKRRAEPVQQSERPPRPVTVQPDIEPLPVSEILPPVDASANPIEIGDALSVQAAAAAAVAMVQAEGDHCAIGEWLSAALQNDANVELALNAVPVSARSVANAVMLWNGDWAPSPPNAAQGMASLKALVMAGVAAAPESCQTQLINGPVLITVGNQTNPTVLAFGSGQWRWQDLLRSTQQMQ